MAEAITPEEWLKDPRRTEGNEVVETETSFEGLRKTIGLDNGEFMASVWPDFDDGRKGRVFLTDPRVTEETTPEQVRSSLREFLVDLLENWDE